VWKKTAAHITNIKFILFPWKVVIFKSHGFSFKKVKKKEAYSDFTSAPGTHNFVHVLIKSVVR